MYFTIWGNATFPSAFYIEQYALFSSICFRKGQFAKVKEKKPVNWVERKYCGELFVIVLP
jgi:hypothetical protein